MLRYRIVKVVLTPVTALSASAAGAAAARNNEKCQNDVNRRKFRWNCWTTNFKYRKSSNPWSLQTLVLHNYIKL